MASGSNAPLMRDSRLCRAGIVSWNQPAFVRPMPCSAENEPPPFKDDVKNPLLNLFSDLARLRFHHGFGGQCVEMQISVSHMPVGLSNPSREFGLQHCLKR